MAGKDIVRVNCGVASFFLTVGADFLTRRDSWICQKIPPDFNLSPVVGLGLFEHGLLQKSAIFAFRPIAVLKHFLTPQFLMILFMPCMFCIIRRGWFGATYYTQG